MHKHPFDEQFLQFDYAFVRGASFRIRNKCDSGYVDSGTHGKRKSSLRSKIIFSNEYAACVSPV